jgi:hypothetical protein
MRGEKRQARGRPWWFQLVENPGHGIRILSHALGNPSTHGRPDPKPRRQRQVVGQSDHKGARPMTARESDPPIVLRERESRSQGEGADGETEPA